MILVDSSVWIDHFRGRSTPETATLQAAVARRQALVGDLILLELLQGARDDVSAARIEQLMRLFPVVDLLGVDLAPRAARNYRRLRELGVTVRKTIDVIIGTYCIEHAHALLHCDRDFAPLEKHLGLRVA